MFDSHETSTTVRLILETHDTSSTVRGQDTGQSWQSRTDLQLGFRFQSWLSLVEIQSGK